MGAELLAKSSNAASKVPELLPGLAVWTLKLVWVTEKLGLSSAVPGSWGSAGGGWLSCEPAGHGIPQGHGHREKSSW